MFDSFFWGAEFLRDTRYLGAKCGKENCRLY